MTTYNDRVRVRERLMALGATTKDIVAKLKAEGVKGQRHSSTCCPIAQYMERFEAGPLVLGQHMTFGSGLRLRVNLPWSVRNFVEDFDLGLYPELEEPKEKVSEPTAP